MQVEEYDIKIALFKGTQLVEFDQIEDSSTEDPKLVNVKGKARDTIYHSMEGKIPYECIIDYKLIEKSLNNEDITINYLAVEPGFYRIVFSNQHSWMRKKTVLYRYCVLTPLEGQDNINEPDIKLPDHSEGKNLMDLLDDEPEI